MVLQMFIVLGTYCKNTMNTYYQGIHGSMPIQIGLVSMVIATKPLHGTEVVLSLLTQLFKVPFSAFPKISFNVAEIYWQHWLEKNGPRLDNVDQTHIALAC